MHALRIPEAPDIRPPLTLAGYGGTNAKAQVNDVLLEFGVRTDLVATDDDTSLLVVSDVKSDNGRVCNGDPGGPVFLGVLIGSEANPFELVAIASAIRRRYGGSPDACLDGIQQYTRLDRTAVRSWLCAKAAVAC